MLVLTRKEGETIKVGPDIVITLTQIRGQKARIGIDAPPEVIISRGELEHPVGAPADREKTLVTS
jgi:carbon storage regulator